ncbi:MAG TPA: ABC transporter permease [Candidatus Polarisedimenticolaceae bacterium]
MSVLDRDHWHEIWEALRGNKVRTLLTAFGVFWGIFLLMVMMGSGNGLERGAMEGFSGGATNSLFVWSQRTTKPWKGMPVGRELDLTDADVAAVRQKVPEAEIVAPRNQLGGFGGGNNVVRRNRSGGFSVMGDVPELARIQTVPLVEGRFLNPIDVADRRKVAVIGTRVRELLFERGESPLSKEIRIQGVYFTVVGVFKSLQSGTRGDRETQTIYIPFSTFQQSFNYGNRVDWLAIKSRDDVPATVTEEKVKALLRARHAVSPDDARAFGSWNLEQEFRKFSGVFTGIRLLVWIVGIGTLAAGVIGVSNIMLVIVRERTHEIGVRRAVGATPFAITSQIVLEAVLLTAAAGYLGLVSGMLAMDGVAAAVANTDSMFFKRPGVEIATALQALGILIASGIAAGLMPAWRALKVPTVEALRSS